jgi:hypothetical protein
MTHESRSTHLSGTTYPSVAPSKPLDSTGSRDRLRVTNPIAMAAPVTVINTTMILSSHVVVDREDAVLSTTL